MGQGQSANESQISEAPVMPVPASRAIASRAAQTSAGDAMGPIYTASPVALSDRVRNLWQNSQPPRLDFPDVGTGVAVASEGLAGNTIFSWNHGGEEVYIVGSFTEQKLRLQRSAYNSSFSLALPLEPGRYQYRFLVDGQWRYDPDQPTLAGYDGRHGTFNEVVVNISQKESRGGGGGGGGGGVQPNSSAQSSGNDDSDSDSSAASVGDRSTIGSSSDLVMDDVEATRKVNFRRYGQRMLSEDDLRYAQEAPQPLPPHFQDVYLNSRHQSIDPYTAPPPTWHVFVDHLLYQQQQEKRTAAANTARGDSSAGASTEDVMVLATTQRFRNKFVTTMYYKPKPSRGGTDTGGK